jgi:hypothetical protein
MYDAETGKSQREGTSMTIDLDPKLESALNDSARRRSLAPEEIVVDILRERLLVAPASTAAGEDWVRRLLGAAKDYGVSLPAEALTSDGMYE